jgi:cell division transport system permease protein
MQSLKTALISLRRSPYQSMLAILVMTILFFVANTFAVTLMGAETILRFFETRPQVIAFFKLTADDAAIKKTAEAVQSRTSVASVKIVTKAEALELYQKDNKDNPLLLELVTADILPASLEVSAKQAADLPIIKQELEQQPEIDEVAFQDDVLKSLLQWTQSLRWAGLFIISILAVTSFLTVVVMVSMKTVTKKKAVSIMQIIGATDWYILSPFFFEGIAYGLTGALIGWVALYGALMYATPWLQSFLGGIITFPIPWQLLLTQLGVSAGAGIFLGGLASLVAARRLLHK